MSITGVTIQHGRVTGDGGGILNNGGRLSLSSVVVANNVAVGTAGSFGGGTGGRRRGQGGGIFNAAGSLSLTKTTITSNQAIGGDGGNGGAIIFVRPRHGGPGRRRRRGSGATAGRRARAAPAKAAGSSTRPARP